MSIHDQDNLSLDKSGNMKNLQHRRSSLSDEEWCEGSTSCSSHSSYSNSYSDDSYIANWENHVCSNGTLFYAEYNSHVGCKSTGVGSDNALNVMKNDLNRASTRRSNKKSTIKLSRLIGRKEKKEDSRMDQQQVTGESSKVTFSEVAQGDVKEVEIVINPENRFKFGRRATATESILGLSTSPFPDGQRLMVVGYMANSEMSQERVIKVGDWIKSINEHEITAHNIEEVLSHFTRPTKVILKFQRISVEESIMLPGNSLQQVNSFDEFATSAKNLLRIAGNEQADVLDSRTPFSLMILTLEFSDADIEANDVLFCYPQKEINDLFGIRGSFLTLNSILKAELNTEPIFSTVIVRGIVYNICYVPYDKVLILFGISSEFATLKEVRLHSISLVQYLQFCYINFNIPLNDSVGHELENICLIFESRIMNSFKTACFEKFLPESHLVSLPKEAQLRIFDAISEMEAMDYRDWNDEPLNSHREFFIFGSALYYKSYLLSSHLPVAQLLGIESFLRFRGIFDFIEKQNVRDLVIWLEIPMMASPSRFFLAIASRNQLLLAVLLQSFETEQRLTDKGIVEERVVGPSLFYIEEIQETLDHLRHGGIEALARTWVTSNKRPEVFNNTNEPKNTATVKRTEVISILKNRSTSAEDVRVNSSMGGSSIHSLTHSEDSNQKLEDADSDSDWDGFPDSHKSSSGFDMSEMKDNFLKEISDVIPSRITAGKENVLFHYVQLDVGSGMIIAPPECSTNPILNSFKNSCQLIHTVLQNTKRFRKLLSQENTKPNTHKSLVAIKEHGILITVHDEFGNEISFWVVGRLFTSPSRELYVCHRSDVPQNLVEIAFRLSFLSAG